MLKSDYWIILIAAYYFALDWLIIKLTIAAQIKTFEMKTLISNFVWID